MVLTPRPEVETALEELARKISDQDLRHMKSGSAAQPCGKPSAFRPIPSHSSSSAEARRRCEKKRCRGGPCGRPAGNHKGCSYRAFPQVRRRSRRLSQSVTSTIWTSVAWGLAYSQGKLGDSSAATAGSEHIYPLTRSDGPGMAARLVGKLSDSTRLRPFSLAR